MLYVLAICLLINLIAICFRGMIGAATFDAYKFHVPVLTVPLISWTGWICVSANLEYKAVYRDYRAICDKLQWSEHVYVNKDRPDVADMLNHPPPNANGPDPSERTHLQLVKSMIPLNGSHESSS